MRLLSSQRRAAHVLRARSVEGHEVLGRGKALVVCAHEPRDYVFERMSNTRQLCGEVPYPQPILGTSDLAFAHVMRRVVREEDGVSRARARVPLVCKVVHGLFHLDHPLAPVIEGSRRQVRIDEDIERQVRRLLVRIEYKAANLDRFSRFDLLPALEALHSVPMPALGLNSDSNPRAFVGRDKLGVSS